MLHAPTFDEMRAKVVEAYREMVPLPKEPESPKPANPRKRSSQ
jgi:hypothetical protein